MKRLILLSCFAASAFAQTYPQVLLEDFSTIRFAGDGHTLTEVYTGEDPGNTGSHESGMFRVNSVNGQSPYVYIMRPRNGGYTFPTGYQQTYVRQGTWSETFNRYRFWVRCNKNVTRNSNDSQSVEIGTYIRPHDDPDSGNQGSHYYHQFNPNHYTNRWVMYEASWKPQYQIGPGLGNYPPDPSFSSEGVHYFDGLTTLYWDPLNTPSWNSGATTCYIDNVELEERTGEPDTVISSVTATYNGTAYEIGWWGPHTTGTKTYQVRYSTTGSIKQNGWSSGTAIPGTFSTTDQYYANVMATTPAMSEATMLWVAIKLSTDPDTSLYEVRVPSTPGLYGITGGGVGIETSILSDGLVRTVYSQTVTATGGTPPYTWSISAGSLPAGLSLNASTGAITGTPTAEGTYNFTVHVLCTSGSTDTQPLSIAVQPATIRRRARGSSVMRTAGTYR